MIEYLLWIWLGIFVVTIAVEFVTSDMVSIWFSLAAIPSFILALLNIDPIVQISVFIIIAAILLIFTRPVVLKYFKVNEIKTNVDSVIGQEGVVTLEITENTVGRVQLRTQEWSAISVEKISIGDKVRILDVEGNKVIVKKI